jgi:hypothetical protein
LAGLPLKKFPLKPGLLQLVKERGVDGGGLGFFFLVAICSSTGCVWVSTAFLQPRKLKIIEVMSRGKKALHMNTNGFMNFFLIDKKDYCRTGRKIRLAFTCIKFHEGMTV